MKKLLTIISILVFLFVLVPAMPVYAATTESVSAQVNASSDDAVRGMGQNYWETDNERNIAGRQSSTDNKWGCGFRFANIDVPHGAKIKKAYITLTACDPEVGSNDGSGIRTYISAEDVDDAKTFSSPANFDDRRKNKTNYMTPWNDIEAWTKNTEHKSPSIIGVIQEIVDRKGWDRGNDIVIFWDDFGGHTTSNEARRSAHSYDSTNSHSKAPELYIRYTYTKSSADEDVESQIEEFASQIKKLDARIDELGSIITELQSRASELSNVSSSLRSDFSSFRDTLNTVASKVEAVKTDVSTLRAESIAIVECVLERSLILEERIDELKSRLTFMTWTFAAILALMGVVMYGILRLLLRGKSYTKRRSAK